jgi:hypothetical protein
MTRFLLLSESCDLLMWGAPSDDRTGLWFTIIAGPRQRSHSRVRARRTRDHILLSQIWDFSFRRLLRLEGLRWRYSTPPPHGGSLLQSQSQSYITTDGQPASLSLNKAPIWGLRSDLDYCLTVAGLLIWGALSDERTGLPFAIATGSRQRSHFRVRVP